MAQMVVLAAFAVGLLACSFAGVPTVVPLLGGFALFFGFGVATGVGWTDMARAAMSGVRTAGKILVTFLFIGLLTAMWRASGTIVFIVQACSGLASGAVMLLAVFLLCALMSFLTGTAFGTAATMGTICAFVATNAGVPILLVGGAVLSGCYFGDRCSPVSTSALLVATLTRTEVVGNIRIMVRTSLVPFALTCIVYLVIGMLAGQGGSDILGLGTSTGDVVAPIDASAVEGAAATDARTTSGQGGTGSPSGSADFSSGFVLTPWELLPAVLVLVLSVLRLDVRLVLALGALSAAVLACSVQGMGVVDIAWASLVGFAPRDDMSPLLAGGGVVSMVNVALIVLVSSTYAGMFEKTRMLDGARGVIDRTGSRWGSFAATLLASLPCALVCCNQTLTIMLTHQLAEKCESDGARAASHLENSAVVVAPLVPWSTAGAVPLAAVGAPAASVAMACYLYLVPLCVLVEEIVRRNRR